MVYNQIIKNGKVTRGGIGVTIVQSDTDKARALLKEAGVTEGAFVETVTAGGGSDKAGIKDGDIIVAVNGKPVRNGNDLIDTVTATPVGTSLDIGVLRDRKRQNFRVVVGDLAQLFPERFGAGNEQESNKAEGSAVSLGMRLENLTDQRRETLGLKEKGGVRVYSVEPDSFADDIGLLAGDVLTSINHQPINTVDDVTRVRNTLKPGDPVTFRVLRKERGPNGEWSPAVCGRHAPQPSLTLCGAGCQRGRSVLQACGPFLWRRWSFHRRGPVPRRAKLNYRHADYSVLGGHAALAALAWSADVATPAKKTGVSQEDRHEVARQEGRRETPLRKPASRRERRPPEPRPRTPPLRKPAPEPPLRAAGRRGRRRSVSRGATGNWRPTPQRYKEIQDALAAKGYLKPEDANGTWNQASVDALKKFQAGQNLDSTGKINSLSLIALGLGPKRETPPPKPPAEAPPAP